MNPEMARQGMAWWYRRFAAHDNGLAWLGAEAPAQKKRSLLRHLAQELGKRTAVDLYGSLKNMAQRLLDSLRYRHWPDEVFDRDGAVPIQIRLDSS